jgi:hypothetical protein
MTRRHSGNQGLISHNPTTGRGGGGVGQSYGRADAAEAARLAISRIAASAATILSKMMCTVISS